MYQHTLKSERAVRKDGWLLYLEGYKHSCVDQQMADYCYQWAANNMSRSSSLCCSRWEASEGTVQRACLAVLPPRCAPLLGTAVPQRCAVQDSQFYCMCSLMALFDLLTGITPFFELPPIWNVEWDAINAVISNARLSYKWSFWTAEPWSGDDFQREGMHPNESAPSGQLEVSKQERISQSGMGFLGDKF